MALLLLLAAPDVQGVVGAVGEARVHAEGHVGGADQLHHQELERLRQALTADRRIAGERGPAGFAVGVVRFLEALGRTHNAVLEGTAFLVAGLVQGKQLVLAELRAFLQDGVDQIAARFLVSGQGGHAALVIEDLVEPEADIVQGRLVGHHLSRPLLF